MTMPPHISHISMASPTDRCCYGRYMLDMLDRIHVHPYLHDPRLRVRRSNDGISFTLSRWNCSGQTNGKSRNSFSQIMQRPQEFRPPNTYSRVLPRFHSLPFFQLSHSSSFGRLLCSGRSSETYCQDLCTSSYLVSHFTNTMSPYLSSTAAQDEPRVSDTRAVFPHIHDDPATLSSSLDPFTITTQNGSYPP